MRPLALALAILAVRTAAGEPLAPTPVRARATALGVVLELRSDFGFERLVEVEYTNGHRVRLNLNDGLTVAVGASFLPLASGRLATRATVGVKLDLLRASNGSALFTAVPVDLVESAYLGPVRVGLGAGVLLWPRVAADGFLDRAAFRFDTAPGAIAEAEWILGAATRTGVGVRASLYRFAWKGVARGAPSVGLVLRSDWDLAGAR